MKQIWRFFFLVPVLLLPSCSSGLAYADKRGDIPSTASGYREALFTERAANLIKREKAGETVYFLHAYSGCSVCQRVEPYLIGALKEFPLAISLIYKTDETTFDWTAYNEDIALLAATYPANEDKTSGYLPQYPVLYRLEGGICKPLDFVSHTDSVASLTNYLKTLARLSGLTHFTATKDALTFSGDKSSPLFLYDETDADAFSFYSTIRALGKNSEKPFAILDYSSMDASQKSEALQAFSLTSYEPVVQYSGKSYDIKKEADSAASLVKNYY
jgi:hypothetical protein